MYLPLTAVLGGSLFVRPEGYQEAARDVVRLSPHIAELQEQVRGRQTSGSSGDGTRAVEAPLVQ